jgi:hypothetical protein
MHPFQSLTRLDWQFLESLSWPEKGAIHVKITILSTPLRGLHKELSNDSKEFCLGSSAISTSIFGLSAKVLDTS